MNLEEIVIKHLKSDRFAHALAEEIAAQYKNKLFDEFDSQIAQAMHDHVKELSKQFIADFGIDADIKRDIKRAYEALTKSELLSLLTASNREEQHN